jgi:pyrroline-5-carboxylate reductase
MAQTRMKKIGILGAGHLASYLIKGFIQARVRPASLSLSPRGSAADLARLHGCLIAPNNQALIDASDVVILSVRPDQAVPAASELAWREGQLLISACAGVGVSALGAACAPATVVRAMPLSAAAIGASPTTLYPDHPLAKDVLSALGPVFPIASEAEFEVASVGGGVYGWVHRLIDLTARWMSERSLSPDTARLLAAATFEAAARMAANQKEQPLADLVARLATPGGITELGLGMLDAAGAPDAWHEACDAVLARLRAQAQGSP